MDKKSRERYLKVLYELEEHNGIKSVEIVEKLNISKPSVNEMLNKLKKENLIKMEKYGKVFLTIKGRRKAEKLFDKHYVIKKFLKHIIKHSEDKAEEEARKIFHYLSDETIQKLENLMEGRLEEPETVLKLTPRYIG